MKVSFWVQSPLSDRDWKRFGFDVLLRRGFEVECFDFTPILNPKFWSKYGYFQVQRPEVKTMYDHKEFGEVMDQWKSGIVVDMLYPGEGSPLANRLRQEARKGVGVIVSVEGLNALPASLHTSGRFSKLWHILKNGDWPRLIRAAMRSFGRTRPIPPLPSRPPVDLRVYSGEAASRCAAAKHLVGAETLWAHSWDFDLYLEHKNGRSDRGDYIVFLDSDMVGHSDYKYADVLSYVSEDRYYSAMNQLFFKMENELKMQVVIAVHPRADLEKLKKGFSGFEAIQGQTPQLVRDASIVVSHSSTGDSFAVLWDKPLLLVTTDQLETTDWFDVMQASCKILNTGRINVDRLPKKISWKTMSDRPKNKYAYYRNQLIKRDGTPKKNSWDIFADWVEQRPRALA